MRETERGREREGLLQAATRWPGGRKRDWMRVRQREKRGREREEREKQCHLCLAKPESDRDLLFRACVR